MNDGITEVALKVKEIMDGIKGFNEKDSAIALTHSTQMITRFNNIIEDNDTLDKRCWMLKRAQVCLKNMEEIYISGEINANDENKIKFITHYSNLNGLISQMEGISNE